MYKGWTQTTKTSTKIQIKRTKKHRTTEEEMEGPTSSWGSRNRLTCLTLQKHDDDDDVLIMFWILIYPSSEACNYALHPFLFSINLSVTLFSFLLSMFRHSIKLYLYPSKVTVRNIQITPVLIRKVCMFAWRQCDRNWTYTHTHTHTHSQIISYSVI